jgi:hypothetical protein
MIFLLFKKQKAKSKKREKSLSLGEIEISRRVELRFN